MLADQHNEVVRGCNQRLLPTEGRLAIALLLLLVQVAVFDCNPYGVGSYATLRLQSKIATNLLTFVNRLLRAQHNKVVQVAIFDCNPYEVGSYATLGCPVFTFW